MVDGAHIDVVHIEEIRQSARSGNLAQELPLCEPRIAECHITRDILHQNPPAQNVLDGAHPLRHVLERLFRVRQRSRSCRFLPATPVQHR